LGLAHPVFHPQPRNAPEFSFVVDTNVSLRATACAAISVSSVRWAFPPLELGPDMRVCNRVFQSDASTVSGFKKLSSRRNVSRRIALGRTGSQLGLVIRAQHDVGAFAREGASRPWDLLEGIDADVGVDEERHPSLSRRSAHPAGAALNSWEMPANDST